MRHVSPRLFIFARFTNCVDKPTTLPYYGNSKGKAAKQPSTEKRNPHDPDTTHRNSSQGSQSGASHDGSLYGEGCQGIGGQPSQCSREGLGHAQQEERQQGQGRQKGRLIYLPAIGPRSQRVPFIFASQP